MILIVSDLILKKKERLQFYIAAYSFSIENQEKCK